MSKFEDKIDEKAIVIEDVLEHKYNRGLTSIEKKCIRIGLIVGINQKDNGKQV